MRSQVSVVPSASWLSPPYMPELPVIAPGRLGLAVVVLLTKKQKIKIFSSQKGIINLSHWKIHENPINNIIYHVVL